MTGHTGFKGGWLSLWLYKNKSQVYGYSLRPPSKKNFYNIVNVKKILSAEKIANVTNYSLLRGFIEENKIEIIFHLAAQPLVRKSYREPFETIKSNTFGTASVLECIRVCDSVKSAIIVTTDKVYKNSKVKNYFKETDILGGREVYCSSKAAAELLVESYSDSFFGVNNKKTKSVATVRAGNVIGGGDWAEDRLIPDCIKSFFKNKSIYIRNPSFTRPWQHVLEPLGGYILLAEKLYTDKNKPKFSAWNFGPKKSEHASVKKVLDLLMKFWKKKVKVSFNNNDKVSLYETKDLFLNSSKAKKLLKWTPKWNLTNSLQKTSDWYLAEDSSNDMYKFSMKQIDEYENKK